MKALTDKIIDCLNDKKDSWIGKEGEVSRQGIKDGIDIAISAIEQIRLHAEFDEVARDLMQFMADRYHPHHVAIVDSTNAQLLEGKQSTGQVLDYIKD